MPRVTVTATDCSTAPNDARRWLTAAGSSLLTHGLGFAAFAASWMWWGEAEDRARAEAVLRANGYDITKLVDVTQNLR